MSFIQQIMEKYANKSVKQMGTNDLHLLDSNKLEIFDGKPNGLNKDLFSMKMDRGTEVTSRVLKKTLPEVNNRINNEVNDRTEKVKMMLSNNSTNGKINTKDKIHSMLGKSNFNIKNTNTGDKINRMLGKSNFNIQNTDTGGKINRMLGKSNFNIQGMNTGDKINRMLGKSNFNIQGMNTGDKINRMLGKSNFNIQGMNTGDKINRMLGKSNFNIQGMNTGDKINRMLGKNIGAKEKISTMIGRKNNSYKLQKGLSLFGDKDGDGIRNIFDCNPLNPLKQGPEQNVDFFVPETAEPAKIETYDNADYEQIDVPNQYESEPIDEEENKGFFSRRPKKLETYDVESESVIPEPVAPEQVAPEQVTPEQVAPEQVAPEQVTPEQVAPEQVKKKKGIFTKIYESTVIPQKLEERKFKVETQKLRTNLLREQNLRLEGNKKPLAQDEINKITNLLNQQKVSEKSTATNKEAITKSELKRILRDNNDRSRNDRSRNSPSLLDNARQGAIQSAKTFGLYKNDWMQAGTKTDAILGVKPNWSVAYSLLQGSPQAEQPYTEKVTNLISLKNIDNKPFFRKVQSPFDAVTQTKEFSPATITGLDVLKRREEDSMLGRSKFMQESLLQPVEDIETNTEKQIEKSVDKIEDKETRFVEREKEPEVIVKKEFVYIPQPMPQTQYIPQPVYSTYPAQVQPQSTSIRQSTQDGKVWSEKSKRPVTYTRGPYKKDKDRQYNY